MRYLFRNHSTLLYVRAGAPMSSRLGQNKPHCQNKTDKKRPPYLEKLKWVDAKPFLFLSGVSFAVKEAVFIINTVFEGK